MRGLSGAVQDAAQWHASFHCLSMDAKENKELEELKWCLETLLRLKALAERNVLINGGAGTVEMLFDALIMWMRDELKRHDPKREDQEHRQ